MQSLRTYRNPRRAISIEALLVWTFRAQRAELEPPRDHDRARAAVGTEWIIFQRGAVLGCTIDCSRRVLPDRVHDDAETVAAVVAGALDWHTATRVAELARAGRRPTCITGQVRCVPAEWQENQHARWPVVALALPARFPGGVWRNAMKERKGRERYEGYCTPVTYDPTPQQVAASRRDYLAWWAAIHEVRERLLAAPVLRDHELTADDAAGVSQLRRSGLVAGRCMYRLMRQERSFGSHPLDDRDADKKLIRACSKGSEPGGFFALQYCAQRSGRFGGLASPIVCAYRKQGLRPFPQAQ